MRRLLTIGLLTTAASCLSSCSDDAEVEQVDRGVGAADAQPVDLSYDEPVDDDPVTGESLLEVARADDRLSTLVTAVEAAGLAETLEGGTYTVFAPTDEAFAALPEGTLDTLRLPGNREQLASVLRYHVVRGKRSAAEIRGRNVLRTASGDTLDVTETSGRFRVGGETGAVVTQADLTAGNGVIHVIDAVLLPPPS